MKIWLIQIGETLPLKTGTRKIRTAYLVDELLKKGHQILWWASAFDHLKKKWIKIENEEIEIRNRFKIKMIKGIGYKSNYSLRRFIDHRIIALKFRKLVLKEDLPDVIVASFPSYDLVYEAVKFSKANGIPIIVDIRDQWPDIFLERVPRSVRPLFRLCLENEYKMVKYALMNADSITSMMNSILAWGLEYAQRNTSDKDRVFHLGYKTVPQEVETHTAFSRALDKLQGKFIVTFIGTFAQYHNPDILIECAKILQSIPQIHFILAGDGEFMDSIKKEAGQYNNITLVGWIEQAEISELLSKSSVGVCTTPQKACFFPNKVFAYMSAGLPIISGFEGELKNLMEKHRFGFYYRPRQADDLCSKIEALFSDSALCEQMSRNSQEIFRKYFDADKIYQDYARFIVDVKESVDKESK